MFESSDRLWASPESSRVNQKRRLLELQGAQLFSFKNNRGNGHLGITLKFQHPLRSASSLLSELAHG